MRRPTGVRVALPPTRSGSSARRHRELREACAAAGVPLRTREDWALPDATVSEAVRRVRAEQTLGAARDALRRAAARREIEIGSTRHDGPLSDGEALLLASVLRSPLLVAPAA